jgi:uncharacterized protein (DUF2336 family)
MILTKADVERLLVDHSPESRLDVLEKVGGNYNGAKFAEREREIAEQIFRLLMKDATLHVREELTKVIRANPSVPRDIVLHLAQDHERVALPILEVTEVLSDADFVNIIESSRELSKLMVISRRPKVSERVSTALVETNYPQIVTSLVQNPGATIGERTLQKIIDDFSSELHVMDAMVSRSHLPLSIVEKLIHRASEEVAAELKAKYHLGDAQMAQDTQHARDESILKLLASKPSVQDLEMLVAAMAGEKRLSPSIIVTALCRGYLNFFRVAMARLSNVPTVNATKLLSDRGGLGMQALYVRAALPQSMYEAMRLLVMVAHDLEQEKVPPGTTLYGNRMVEQLLAMAGDREIENLPYLMALIRQKSS